MYCLSKIPRTYTSDDIPEEPEDPRNDSSNSDSNEDRQKWSSGVHEVRSVKRLGNNVTWSEDEDEKEGEVAGDNNDDSEGVEEDSGEWDDDDERNEMIES